MNTRIVIRNLHWLPLVLDHGFPCFLNTFIDFYNGFLQWTLSLLLRDFIYLNCLPNLLSGSVYTSRVPFHMSAEFLFVCLRKNQPSLHLDTELRTRRNLSEHHNNFDLYLRGLCLYFYSHDNKAGACLAKLLKHHLAHIKSYTLPPRLASALPIPKISLTNLILIKK